MKALILAGGSGTRLWPVSRKKHPKQVRPFLEDQETLLEKTFRRLEKGFRVQDIFVATGEDYSYLVRKQLPHLAPSNIFLEPEKKNTAPAIGLAAIRLLKLDPQSIMVTINSDAYVKDEKEYLKVLRIGERLARKNPDYSILIGVRPTYPETGYGYIKIGEFFREISGYQVFKVEKFIEKPELKKAKRLLKEEQYLWNPALFISRVDHLLGLFKIHLPELYHHLAKIKRVLGTEKEIQVIKEEFKKIKPVSIDYGLLEKEKKILVLPARFRWADVGHWRSVQEILSPHKKENVVKGKHLGFKTKGSLIYSTSSRLIATCGIKNLIIIDTQDVLLVCSRDRAQEVKKLVEKLEEEEREEYL